MSCEYKKSSCCKVSCYNAKLGYISEWMRENFGEWMNEIYNSEQLKKPRRNSTLLASVILFSIIYILYVGKLFRKN